ncbi:MAG: flagellin [Butyribacter sp.]|nr:flagellin [bacterium]MDY3854079.1 flagellin [Butyribacter sp.]
MRINHNISAQLANVNLKKTNRKMSATLESLSSGYKINKAADDSAGLAISNKMRAQIRALDQASRNAGDGESLLQTAEGSLNEIESLIQRMRELSVQAANDTNATSDRKAMQEEIDALMDEVDRIASTTEFNGKGLLDGSSSRAVTFDTNGFTDVSLSSGVHSGNYEVEVIQQATIAEGKLTYTIPSTGTANYKINGETITLSSSDTETEAYDKILTVCSYLGIEVDGSPYSGSLDLSTKAKGSKQFIEVEDATGTVISKDKGEDCMVKPVTGFSDGVMCRGNGESVILRDNSGFEMQLSIDEDVTVGTKTEITVYDAGAMKLQIGANESQNMSIDLQAISCASLEFREIDGTNKVNVCSSQGAQNAMSVFDAAINTISSYRSQLGAYTNRLESTVASLDVSSENITESMSRIMDTDMATAMTQYTQENVLSQAATSMLAQANNRPQTIMSLLQG